MDTLINFYHMAYGQGINAIALGVAICSILFVFYTMKKQNRLMQQFNKLNEELLIANRGAIGMGQQIIALEKRLQQVSVAPAKAHTADGASSPVATVMSQLVQNTREKTQPIIEDVIDNSLADKNTSQPSAFQKPTTPSHISEDASTDKLSLARDLLAKGKALTEVANTCQLSFAEVSLLRALNPTDPNSKYTH